MSVNSISSPAATAVLMINVESQLLGGVLAARHRQRSSSVTVAGGRKPKRARYEDEPLVESGLLWPWHAPAGCHRPAPRVPSGGDGSRLSWS